MVVLWLQLLAVASSSAGVGVFGGGGSGARSNGDDTCPVVGVTGVCCPRAKKLTVFVTAGASGLT